MDVKELMIGDWVNIKGCETSQIRDLKDLLNVELGIFETSGVPLTEEILKANGFKEIYKYEWRDGIMVSEWRYKSDDLEEWFEIKYAPTYDDFTWKAVEVNNVHNLQHALRLCGLNELADNFKLQ